MTKARLLAALVASTLPSIAAAELSGDITLGFGRTDVQDLETDVNTTYLGFSSDLSLGSNVTAGIDLNFLRASASDFDVDADLQGFGLDLAYGFGNGLSAGIYGQRASLSASADGFDLFGDLSTTSLGVMGGYSGQGVDVTAFAGQTSTDPSLPDGWDINDLGLAARFQPTEQVKLGASFIRSTLDTPDGDLTLSSLGIAAGMSLSERWSLFVGANRAELDDFGADITDVGLGLGYTMPSFPGMLFAEVSRATLGVDGLGDVDLDSLQVGISFPLGGSATRIPNGTVAGGVLGQNYSSAAQAVRNSF